MWSSDQEQPVYPWRESRIAWDRNFEVVKRVWVHVFGQLVRTWPVGPTAKPICGHWRLTRVSVIERVFRLCMKSEERVSFSSPSSFAKVTRLQSNFPPIRKDSNSPISAHLQPRRKISYDIILRLWLVNLICIHRLILPSLNCTKINPTV
jgi:hypothetical protein